MSVRFKHRANDEVSLLRSNIESAANLARSMSQPVGAAISKRALSEGECRQKLLRLRMLLASYRDKYDTEVKPEAADIERLVRENADTDQPEWLKEAGELVEVLRGFDAMLDAFKNMSA